MPDQRLVEFELLADRPFRFRDGMAWEFDFLQNVGSWSWTFVTCLRKVKGVFNLFEVFFLPDAPALGPKGELTIEYSGTMTIKVPLKVLAHQFAGNLGQM